MSDIGIIEFSPVAQYAIDREHRITRWNRACELLTGRSAAQMVGTDRHWEPFYPEKRPTLADFVVEHDRKGMRSLYGQERVSRSGVVPHAWETEDFFEDVGGQARHLRFLAAPVYDESGEISGAVESFLDVTEQKDFEKALMQSEEVYRILAENVPDGVALMQGGRFVMVNQAFARMFGYAGPEDVAGRPSHDLISEGHREMFRETLEALESGRSEEKTLRWPGVAGDGREIWVEGHPNVINWENRPAVLSTVIDITETRARELAAEEEARRLKRENIQLRSSIRDRYRFGNIVGKSLVMQEVYELILRAAAGSASVIIYGESGTGKELVARAIHDMSDRHDREFVAVNCGAIPETLLESEFFGYRKGAFTGAHADKGGFLDRAGGGTLFLDEVGDLSLNIQVKLLRAIEGGGYTPVGSSKAETSDFRMIAATNRDLKERMRKGLMREDFFYRVHVIPIHLPPLRERKEDIPLLVDHFLRSGKQGRELSSLPGRVMESLYSYRWPGNVRELQNALHRYLTVGRLDFIHADQVLSPDVSEIPGRRGKEVVGDLRTAVVEVERDMIARALHQTGWNRSRAADLLGIPRKTLFRKMKKMGTPDKLPERV
ncbi:MAG: sigma 54-interacting transcriptional regulator [Deltaproteobacteria bacterium]|nr:sigma 54-interacting transcriptional regulator [Deltaproteobacteria bacterium]